MFGHEFFVDPSRCIGCQSCVNACAECDSHRGRTMIHVDFLDRPSSTASVPFVCMHCEDPTCAQVCPADAIKRGEDGVVQSSLKPRCVACRNCVLGCPFGIPRVFDEIEQMQKCDLCYDRTALGKRPMCATVCPSQALTYRPAEEVLPGRRERPVDQFVFGKQAVRTRVSMMLPLGRDCLPVDVADYLPEEPR
jgi:Fe-S-cluster-containing dehydrogenase component